MIFSHGDKVVINNPGSFFHKKKAVVKFVGIGSKIVRGQQLPLFYDIEVEEKVSKRTLLTRVQPEHLIGIIK